MNQKVLDHRDAPAYSPARGHLVVSAGVVELPQTRQTGARQGGPAPIAGRHGRTRAPLITLARQLVLMSGAALLYFGVRGVTESSAERARAHARTLIGFERRLGMDVEGALQRLVLDHRVLVTAANWVYIWGHWPVIVMTFVWLHRRDVGTYRVFRNAMFISGAIGLVIFALYPVAPPRLAGAGFVDTVTELSHSYRVLQPPSLVNKYAALPSLHVGWNLLVGVFVYRNARHRWMRRVGAASPAFMVAAVVLTGNHYVVDAALGAMVALTGLWLAERLAVSRRDTSSQNSWATRPSLRPLDDQG